METVEVVTALDAIFKDSASASMSNEDDEQLPNTLKESLASIEAKVECAANLNFKTQRKEMCINTTVPTRCE